MSNRISHIDILKGLGIILVVLGHVTQYKPLHDFIYAFHMPLFFLVSGLFLHDKKGFVRSHARSLLLPYLTFGLLTFVYWWLIESRFRELGTGESVSSQLVNLFIPTEMQLCNVVLWFLPCLFLASVAVNWINKSVRSVSGRLWIVGGLVIVAGFFGSHLPFHLGQATQASPYLLITSVLGGGIAGADIYLKDKRLASIVIGFAGLAGIWLSGVSCNMLGTSYIPCYPVCFVVALFGSACLYLLAYAIRKSHLLSWLGMNSLAIMLMHEPVKRIVIQLYALCWGESSDALRSSIWQSIIMTILTLLVLFPMVLFINRYFPFLLGKKRKKI